MYTSCTIYSYALRLYTVVMYFGYVRRIMYSYVLCENQGKPTQNTGGTENTTSSLPKHGSRNARKTNTKHGRSGKHDILSTKTLFAKCKENRYKTQAERKTRHPIYQIMVP